MRAPAPALVIGVLGALSVLAAAASFSRERRQGHRLAGLIGADGGRSGRQGPSAVLARIGRTPLARRLAVDARVRRRLDLAGRAPLAEALPGLRVVILATTSVVGGALALLSPLAIVVIPLVAAVALRLPDIALARLARRRQQAIGAQVPEFVELLVATTEAGLGPPLALQRSSEVLTGPLGDELRGAVRQMELGLSWREAMGQLVDRTEVPSLRSLTAALSRSERLGASIRATLRGIAEDLRTERRVRAEEAARRAPVKMLFPLVFMVLPAFLLLTVGPVLLATLRSLHSG